MEAEGRKTKLDAKAERMREAGRCKSKKPEDTSSLYIYRNVTCLYLRSGLDRKPSPKRTEGLDLKLDLNS